MSTDDLLELVKSDDMKAKRRGSSALLENFLGDRPDAEKLKVSNGQL